MRISLISLFVWFLSAVSYSQDPPVLICADVAQNGDVTLHWLPPASASGLIRYDIYHLEGTYVKIGEVLVGATTYVHAGAQADLQSHSYYVDAVYTAGNNSSDSLQTLFLQMAVSVDFNEATLYWSQLSNPLPGGSGSLYDIYMEDPYDLSWNLIGSEEEEPFVWDVFVCNEWVNFRVELQNSNGCTSRSNIRGGQFLDVIKPVKPVFDSVSINYFNDVPHIVLGWDAALSQDVEGYVLYRHQGSNFAFDTVFGINNTFYIDSTVIACDSIYKYTIASIDSCGNVSPLTEPLQNIHLIDVDYDPCRLQATITFEPFIDLEADSLRYDLARFSGLGSKNTNETYKWPAFYEPGLRKNTQYEIIKDKDLKVGRVYDYFIRETVYKNGTYYTTSSCIKTIFAYGYQKPLYSYFANADVLPDNQIALTIDYDTAVKSSSLAIWRSDPGESELNYLRTIAIDTLTEWPVRLVDTSADGSKGFYNYQVKVMDSCGHKWIESNKLKTIHLRVTILDKNHNQLRWNRFQGWDKYVSKYYIYRLEDASSPVTPIDSVEFYADIYEYTDDISAISGTVERLVYWVRAVEGQEDAFGFKEKSNSNRTAVTPESDVYFPNAFKPGGTDPVFKPVFRFLGGPNYLFQIYNRWGQLLFETTDSQAGWDGTYKGAFVQQGVYIYKFQYRDVFGNSVNRQGTVTVIY